MKITKERIIVVLVGIISIILYFAFVGNAARMINPQVYGWSEEELEQAKACQKESLELIASVGDEALARENTKKYYACILENTPE